VLTAYPSIQGVRNSARYMWVRRFSFEKVIDSGSRTGAQKIRRISSLMVF
jgi:hypothetical protein